MGDEEEPVKKRVVFIHNCGSYVGSNVARRFAQNQDSPAIVIGTLGDGQMKPRWVSRVVESTPGALREAFLEAELTVLDCLGAMTSAEEILAEVTATGELSDEKVLVGISSVMTWTRITPDAEEPEKQLTEEEYKRRRPHANFKDLLALEKLITKCKRPGLRTHVVAAGLTYGFEEDLFSDLFKLAWSNLPLPLLTLGEGEAAGANVLPTIHVADLCAIVEKLAEADSLPYLLALDAGVLQEEKQTLAKVTASLASELGAGAVEPLPLEQVVLQRDYQFFQVGVLLQAAAVNELGIEWHCETGLLQNMPKVVHEFRESRGLLPLRVLVHGNDELAKHELATAIAAEYRISHLVAAAVVAEQATKEEAKKDEEGNSTEEMVPTPLAAELKAAGATPPAPLVAQALLAALKEAPCRNQGFVLEGFPSNADEAALLFKKGRKAAAEGEEEAEEPPEEEAAEGDAAKLGAVEPVEFVLVAEASDEHIMQKMMALASPPVTEAELKAQLEAYATHNAEESPSSILALPSFVDVEPLVLRTDDAGMTAENCLARSRIYLQAPRNYGPTEEELAAKRALEEEAAAAAAAQEAAQEAEREAAEAEARRAREAHSMRRLAELQQQEQELLEVRSLPLRNYLMQHVIPTLTEGLIEVCKLKPDDPVDHLAEWLFKNNPVEDD